jgi:hypothetical protein
MNSRTCKYRQLDHVLCCSAHLEQQVTALEVAPTSGIVQGGVAILVSLAHSCLTENTIPICGSWYWYANIQCVKTCPKPGLPQV